MTWKSGTKRNGGRNNMLFVILALIIGWIFNLTWVIWILHFWLAYVCIHILSELIVRYLPREK